MTAHELRGLDAEVHRKVFGKVAHTDKWGNHFTDEVGLLGLRSVPHYSRDIEAAWLVVEALGNWMFDMEWGFVEGLCFGDWLPVHANLSAAGWRVKVGPHTVLAPTFPEAVCRAALAATESKCGRTRP